MSRRRLVGVVLLVMLALASLSFNACRTFQVTDGAGTPLSPAYIAYSHVGARFNPVHASTYQASRLALARGDREGRVAIPAAFHIHRPFPIEGHPSVRVELVYVPQMHNGWGQFNKGSPSYPGNFEIDATRRRATVSDLGGQPQLWEGTLRNLSSVIQRLVSTRPGEAPLRKADPATAALTLELMGHFRQEYESFLARYGDVARPRPEMPQHLLDSERRGWTEMVDADLARYPRWGDEISRLFRDEVRLFSRWEKELR